MSKSFLRFVLLTMISSVIAQKKPGFIAYVENGDPVDRGEYPYFAYFQSSNVACGGTLIAPDLVLTAAHCAKNYTFDIDKANKRDSFVYIGAYDKTDLDDGTDVRHCVDYIRHPLWDPKKQFQI